MCVPFLLQSRLASTCSIRHRTGWPLAFRSNWQRRPPRLVAEAIQTPGLNPEESERQSSARADAKNRPCSRWPTSSDVDLDSMMGSARLGRLSTILSNSSSPIRVPSSPTRPMLAGPRRPLR